MSVCLSVYCDLNSPAERPHEILVDEEVSPTHSNVVLGEAVALVTDLRENCEGFADCAQRPGVV